MSREDFSWNELPADPDAPVEGPPAQPEVAAMSFEVALAELERIVTDLERGELDLDQAIQAYERGTELRLHCERKLKEARLRVERITLGEQGKIGSEPAAFD